MARLREDSDDEFPDLAVLIKKHTQRPPSNLTKPSPDATSSQDNNGVEQAGIPTDAVRKNEQVTSPHGGGRVASASLISNKPSARTPARRQRPLKSAKNLNRGLFPTLPTPCQSLFANDKENSASEPRTARRDSPKRRAQRAICHESRHKPPVASDSESQGSSWSADTASEGEEDSLVHLSAFTRPTPIPLRLAGTPRKGSSGSERHRHDSRLAEPPTVQRVTSQPKPKTVIEDSSSVTHSTPFTNALQRPSSSNWTNSRPSSSSDNDRKAILTFNPPKKLSPAKLPPPHRPTTPPAEPVSPSKSRLVSPSKRRERIPTPPYRPSLDAFWSQSVINEWNDQYSPRKTLRSPKKPRSPLKTTSLPNTNSLSDDDDDDSPSLSASPRKSPAKKRDKAALEARKAFEARKCDVAEAFLRELDEEITGGKVAELASSSGGVKIVWSRKLNSTAGRANWRRETLRKKASDGDTVVEVKHHASVELAEKVIDGEDRLINVLAHEYCHLANFMISGIKDNPHGKEFKEWAKRCSIAFGHRGVEVTTKHSYAIDYKYIWECISCAHEFKRHSKSIDPAKHTCGGCKSRLVQTKPPVRNAKASEYHLFVKEHFQRIKRENDGVSHGVVMELIGKLYREQKTQKAQKADGGGDNGTADGVDTVVRALDVITLGD